MVKTDIQNLTKQLGFGLTVAGVTGSYALCLCAALNQGIIVVLICILLFTLASVKKDHIYAPSPLLAVIFFFLLQFNSFAGAIISLLLGCIICYCLNRFTQGQKVPDFITGGCFIGLALCATILFTNTYFGIGASGFTPLEMLKGYRSLGFHPDFRGLLYGTITLFTMITYPFKFRRLKNIIPAEFITVAIPFVLNLILNPDPDRTTTNEYSSIDLYSEMFNPGNSFAIFGLLTTSVATGFILYALSQSSQSEHGSSFLMIHPVIPCGTTAFTTVSLLSALAVPGVIILLFPSLISRLPLPCAGAMLIVSAWQHTSFRPLSSTFKEKSIFKLLLLILCGTFFVILPVFYAVAFCSVIWLFTEIVNHRREAKK